MRIHRLPVSVVTFMKGSLHIYKLIPTHDFYMLIYNIK